MAVFALAVAATPRPPRRASAARAATMSSRGCEPAESTPPPEAGVLPDCGEPRLQANRRLGNRYRCLNSGSCQLLLGCLDVLCDLSDRSRRKQLRLRHRTAVIERRSATCGENGGQPQ